MNACRTCSCVNAYCMLQAPGVGDGQGSLVCCSPWGYKESDTTEQLHRTECNLKMRFLWSCHLQSPAEPWAQVDAAGSSPAL